MADLSAVLFGNKGAPSPNVIDNIAPAKQDELAVKMYEDAQKRLNAFRDNLVVSEGFNRKLDQFGAINRLVETGSGYDGMFQDTPAMHGQGWQDMKALQGPLSSGLRPANTGSTSDYEGRVYLSGVPSVDKKGMANKAIRTRFQSDLQYNVDQLKFLEAYMKSHGNLDGADVQWSAMRPKPTSDMPFPTKEAINALKMNPSKAGDFDALFGAGASKQVLGK